MPAINQFPQLKASSGASNVNFQPAASTGVVRTAQGKMRDFVSVMDFGAVGDGIADDTDAVNKALAALIDNQRGGTIYFPPGEYKMTSPLVIEPISGRDFVSDIHWQGAGGHHTDIATRILLAGSAGSAGLTLKSAVQMSFDDIDFVGTTGSLAAVRTDTAGAIPFYSSILITFRNCRFAMVNPVKATVWVNNSTNVEFDNCFWNSFDTGTGSQIMVQIGSDAADIGNAGTFSGGNANQVRFVQCFLQGDVSIRRARGISLNSCAFDADAVTGIGGRVYANGDQLVRGLKLDNCWAGYGDNTDTFLRMGTSGYDLTVTNCYIATYAKGILLNGVGVAHIEGNEFALDTSGAEAIHVLTTNFYGATVQNNHYAGMHATSTFVRDDRSSPSTPTAIAPVEVNANLGLDATADMTGYAAVLTQSVKLTGGLYRIQSMITISTGATASVFRARVNLGSQTPRVGGSIYIPANQTATLTICRDVYLEGTSTATTASLEVHQVTAGTAATIEATDTINTTMMQMTRATG